MSIKIDWDDDAKTIIRYSFGERWTWADFFAAKKQAYDMIATVPHGVGVIMEAPTNMILPPNVLSQGLNALRNKHPNTLIVVFVLTQPFLRSILGVLAKVSNTAASTTRIVYTLDEARAIVHARLRSLHNDDVTLPER